MNKKIVTILVIILLVGTIGVATANATVLYGFRNRPRYNDLVNKWVEIQNAKQELRTTMEGYGINLPDLTIEEKKEIISLILELRKDGASRDEIREEIVDLLIDFGADLPDLTSEQRAEIRNKIKTMLEVNYGFLFVELTPEQKAYIKQTIIQMKRQGSSKEEIKIEVINLYINYGGVIPELTDTQKEEIHDWIIDMLKNDYGINLPDLTLEQRQEIKEQRSDIKELQKELQEMFKNTRFLTKIRFLRYLRQNSN